jgi:hypothetical protein
VEFSEEEFAHWFLPRQGVVYAYVVESKARTICPFFFFFFFFFQALSKSANNLN